MGLKYHKRKTKEQPFIGDKGRLLMYLHPTFCFQIMWQSFPVFHANVIFTYSAQRLM